MSSGETTPDVNYNELVQLAFGDAEFRTIAVNEDYDMSADWGDAARPVSGSKREIDIYVQSLETEVRLREEMVLLDRDVGSGYGSDTHTLSLEYDNLPEMDAVCLDENWIINEIWDDDFDTLAAKRRIILALSAATDKRMGFDTLDTL